MTSSYFLSVIWEENIGICQSVKVQKSCLKGNRNLTNSLLNGLNINLQTIKNPGS